MNKHIFIALFSLLLSFKVSAEDVNQSEEEVFNHMPQFTHWLRTACNDGDGRACLKLGQFLVKYSQSHIAPKYFERGCLNNNPLACERAPASTPPIEETPPDLETTTAEEDVIEEETSVEAPIAGASTQVPQDSVSENTSAKPTIPAQPSN